MAAKARAIYDFQGDESQGELVLRAGDVIIIHRQDVGEGWWEGELRGRTGLFPESYVELDEGGGGGGGGGDEDEDWDDEEEEGGWDEGQDDDEPDDEDGAGSNSSGGYAAPAASTPRKSTSLAMPANDSGRTGTLKRSVNRFSTFVKAGAEGFLLGAVKDVTIDRDAVIRIIDGGNGNPEWEGIPPYGHIAVSKAGKRDKFKGMKSYEAYSISGGPSGAQVERRHKHFQWLHERLSAKYSCICVPPLPDKQFMSRYGETFVDKRQQKLEMWINRVCRHPVLSGDQLSLHHFLACATSDSKGWKMGKRKAEKDAFVNATFFKLLASEVECPRDATAKIDMFGHFVQDMGKVVKKCSDTAVAHAARMSGAIKQEYKKVSLTFTALGEVFGKAGDGDSVKVSMAMSNMGNTYDAIAEMWNIQPKYDQLPWLDGLKEYQAMIGQFGDAVTSSKSAQAKAEEIQNLEAAKEADKEAVQSRANVIHLLTLCELRHFQKQRLHDFKHYLKNYLAAQIKFHQDIVGKLQQAQNEFEKLPDFA